MTNSKLRSGILVALMMMALGTLIACASTDESGDDGGGSGGGSGSGRDCTDECGVIPGQSYDECMAVCD
jgi:hypothetical protein